MRWGQGQEATMAAAIIVALVIVASVGGLLADMTILETIFGALFIIGIIVGCILLWQSRHATP